MTVNPADPAAVWLAATRPDQPPLPTDDTGRNHREVVLDDTSLYWEVTSARPGTRGNPRWRRLAAEASYNPAAQLWAADARRLGRQQGGCNHCGLNLPRRPGAHCDACSRYRSRTGHLPDTATLDKRQTHIKTHRSDAPGDTRGTLGA